MLLRRHTIPLILLLACLVPLLAGPAPARAAIAAPVLKWQNGGCQDIWCQTGWYSSPAVADLNGDGSPEVIWGAYDLVALNGADGSLLWRAPNGARVWPGVAVADLTGDGAMEVIAGRGNDQVTVYSATGAELWTRNPFGNGEVRTLAVTDLESDGTQEIIVGRASGGETKQLSVYEPNGSVRPGWPARRDGEPGYGWGMYNENVAIADMTGDGFKEIYGPTDTHYITALERDGSQLRINSLYTNSNSQGRQFWSEVGVHVDHAADLRGYAECGTEHRPNFANSAPAIGDLNGDGTLELVVVGDVYNCAIGDPDGDMYLLPWIFRSDRTRWSGNGFDWQVIPAPEPNSGPLSQDYERIETVAENAVIADLDGDGFKEILYPSYDGRVHAYWLDKTQHGAWPYAVPGTGIHFASEPVVADLDGDGKAEVIFTSWAEKANGENGQLHILDWQGNPLQVVPLPDPPNPAVQWSGALGAPTIANIDGDPEMEIVIGTVAAGVVAYDLPGTAGARCLWCTGRGSNARTGLAPADISFSMVAGTDALVLNAGDSANLTLTFQGPAGAQPVNLSAVSNPPGLSLNLSAALVTPPDNANLMITDSHPAGPLKPGIWYTVTVSGNSGAIMRTAAISVLVGGDRVYLPVVRR